MTLEETINSRRAYRSLDPCDIPDETLRRLAQAASLAPSCYNKQPWRFVFVRDEPWLGRLKDCLSEGNRWARDASLIVAVCSRPDLDCVLPDGRRYYAFDTGMATALLMLTATESGLVCHPIAGYDPKRAAETLGLPQDTEVLTLLIVGRKAAEPKPFFTDWQKEAETVRPPRIPLADFAFLNAWDRGLPS